MTDLHRASLLRLEDQALSTLPRDVHPGPASPVAVRPGCTREADR